MLETFQPRPSLYHGDLVRHFATLLSGCSCVHLSGAKIVGGTVDGNLAALGNRIGDTGFFAFVNASGIHICILRIGKQCIYLILPGRAYRNLAYMRKHHRLQR